MYTVIKQLSDRYNFSGLREATFTRVHIISHVELMCLHGNRPLLVGLRLRMVSAIVDTHWNGLYHCGYA